MVSQKKIETFILQVGKGLSYKSFFNSKTIITKKNAQLNKLHYLIEKNNNDNIIKKRVN